jgi:isopropylmalate/homocitrate/citramalate synthase
MRWGVDLIEAGFPIASLDDAEGVKQVAATRAASRHRALARCRPKTSSAPASR